MPHYQRLGKLPAKRHIEMPAEPGFRNEGLHYEEVITTEGFHRAFSIVYHLKPPTRVRQVERLADRPTLQAVPAGLRPYHILTKDLPRSGDAISGRIPIFFNSDLTISRCVPAEQQQILYKNAGADEILFVHHGSGQLQTMFGLLPFRAEDYIVIPRGTIYRIHWEKLSEAQLLVVESPAAVRLPNRYFNPDGQIRMGAPYSERDFHPPAEIHAIDSEEDIEIRIVRGQEQYRYILANHPFDVVGWDGHLYPYTFNAQDFEPITGTIHQPPPIHQTFQTDSYVVCTFAPRVLDTHPQAVKVPYAHSNVDSDEVLYYVRGHFGSRRGVGESSFTLHPSGIPHGPHPGTIVKSRGMTRTDELAVMVDTFRPLHLAAQALPFDDPKYPQSWLD